MIAPKKERKARGPYKRHPRPNPKTECPRCHGLLTVYDTRTGEEYVTRKLRCTSARCDYKTDEIDPITPKKQES